MKPLRSCAQLVRSIRIPQLRKGALPCALSCEGVIGGVRARSPMRSRGGTHGCAESQ